MEGQKYKLGKFLLGAGETLLAVPTKQSHGREILHSLVRYVKSPEKLRCGSLPEPPRDERVNNVTLHERRFRATKPTRGARRDPDSSLLCGAF
jgi:hypothetical protein